MRKLVFVGNCQAFRFKEMYAECFAPALGDEVSFVPSYAEPGPDSEALVADANVVALQLFDQEQPAGLHNLPTAGKIVSFPTLTGLFLWPTAGEPHPLNKPEQYLPGGPFDMNMGDRLLNRKLAGGTLSDAQTAQIADEYVDTDIAKLSHAERVYELMIDRQKRRDAASGLDCAKIIQEHLQKEWLFPIPTTFNLRLFRHMAERLYEQLGVPTRLIRASIDPLVASPFPVIQRPIHPSVVKCFDLSYIASDQRYVFWTGELLSVRDYVIRYLRYDWNASMLDPLMAVEHNQATDLAGSAAALRAGLVAGFPSARVERALSDVLARLGDRAGALGAYERAMALDRDNPHAEGHYAHLLMENGRIDRALDILRGAIARWPAFPLLRHRLAQMLLGHGRLGEVVMALDDAVNACPHDPSLVPPYRELAARLLGQEGPTPEALYYVARASSIEPIDTDYSLGCAGSLDNLDRPSEAIAVLQTAVAAVPTDPRLFRRLGALLARSGKSDAAEAMLLEACRLDPQDSETAEALKRIQQSTPAVVSSGDSATGYETEVKAPLPEAPHHPKATPDAGMRPPGPAPSSDQKSGASWLSRLVSSVTLRHRS